MTGRPAETGDHNAGIEKAKMAANGSSEATTGEAAATGPISRTIKASVHQAVDSHDARGNVGSCGTETAPPCHRLEAVEAEMVAHLNRVTRETRRRPSFKRLSFDQLERALSDLKDQGRVHFRNVARLLFLWKPNWQAHFDDWFVDSLVNAILEGRKIHDLLEVRDVPHARAITGMRVSREETMRDGSGMVSGCKSAGNPDVEDETGGAYVGPVLEPDDIREVLEDIGNLQRAGNNYGGPVDEAESCPATLRSRVR